MCIEYLLTLVKIFKNGERPVSFIPARTERDKARQTDLLAKKWHRSTHNLQEALSVRKHEQLHAHEFKAPALFGFNARSGKAHTYSVGGVSEEEAYLSAIAGLMHGETTRDDARTAGNIVRRSKRPKDYFPQLFQSRFGVSLPRAITKRNTLVDHKK